ncbi:spinster family MFS transporter [Novosphingobium sediminicola]|uniref:MFS family permease n=1 Tax=Novosphingobium sediminicola TaxID=563162 RepID=A0A7W6G8X6_9SPHN|nr:MFS transporter [Novosphingobium sediminicola]MBB3957670.1 MFS family permease [Novosphingobium sediminicola]
MKHRPEEAVDTSRAYRRSALLLLTLVYIFNFVDRQVLNILAEAIKHDLALSDTQLGIVTGLAFALFYSLLGVPIARFAERADRPRLIAVALSVWSLFTLLCGAAGSFAQMLICRLGVGIGEAGGVPPSHSLIAEFSPKARRAVALAIFSTGLPLGSFIGLGFGGILGDALGWRWTFVVAGAPGLLIAVVVMLVLKEPRRTFPLLTSTAPAEPLRASLASFLSTSTYRWTVAGGALQAVVLYGTGAFLAPFFLRAHGPELAALAAGLGLKANGFLGLAFGVTVGLAGAVGTFFGGWLGDRFHGASLKSYVTVPALAGWLSIPAFLVVFSSHDLATAFLALGFANAMINAYFGPMHATCQGVAGASRRATVSAVTLVIVNLVGLGLGPPLVGMISDHAHGAMAMQSKDALRLALMAISAVSLLAGLAFWRARASIDADTVS